MPYSSPDFKDQVKQHLIENIRERDYILDVGPGCGTYGKMINGFNYKIDCIEIHEPYIQQFKLEDIYRKVFVGNVLDFNFKLYKYIILGDILEHLSVEDAISLLDRINANGHKCLIAVPYLYEQGEWEGNIYEIHLQPDLTPEKMKSRYPSLRLLIGNEHYGYYTNY